MKAQPRDSPWGVLIAATTPTIANGLLSLCDVVAEQNTFFFSSLLQRRSPSRAESCNPICSSARVLKHPHEGIVAAIQLLEKTYCGSNSILILPLVNESTTIGRMPTNDIRIANPCISSVHCRVLMAQLPSTTYRTGMRNAENALLLSHSANKNEAEKEALVETCPLIDSPEFAPCGRLPLVTLADLSRNSCRVNENPVGKGKSYRGVKSGDMLVLLDAGVRTPEYNVKFVFFFWEDFHSLLSTASSFSKLLCQIAIPCKTTGNPNSNLGSPPSNSVESREELQISDEKGAIVQRLDPPNSVKKKSTAVVAHNEKKRRILLLSAWNAAAQTQRMYAHSVEDFYVLDKTCPLGEGAFGKVYRAAFRPLPLHLSGEQRRKTDSSTSSSPFGNGTETNQDKKDGEQGYSERREELVSFPPLPSPFSLLSEWDEAEICRQREAYISRKELVPSSDIVKASKRMEEQIAAMHSSQRWRKRRRTDEDTEHSSKEQKGLNHEIGDSNPLSTTDMLAYGFAVKIVAKRHLWLEDSTDSVEMVWGGTRIPVSVEEQQALQQLVQLGTPLEEYKEKREAYFFNNEFRQARSCLSSSFSFSQETPASGEVLERDLSSAKNKLDLATREAKRNECLQKLSPQARQLYRRARRSSEHLQCEVNILISVSHPNVVRLYEIFDNGKELALVMEQATGGDVWDLLQPAKQAPSHAGMARSTLMMHHFQEGGPLPEFIVKIIIAQVLEAVLYLHSMGVIHRDLKLENLLLQRPISVGQLVRSQCEILLLKLTHLVTHMQKEKGEFEAALASFSVSDQVPCRAAQCNPLSPLYTVHLPRRLWPVVKVTDFGLSRMLEASNLCSRTKLKESMKENQGLDIMYATNQFRTSCGTSHYSAPEVLHNELRPNKIGYSAAVDMFSIGVIAFALLTNRLPYPPPKEDKSRGTVVIDYKTPLCFERVRRVLRSTEQRCPTSLPPLPGSPLPFIALSQWTSSVGTPLPQSQWSNWEQQVLQGFLFHQKAENGSKVPADSEQFFQELKLLQHRLKMFCTKLSENEMDVDRLLISSYCEEKGRRRNELLHQTEGEIFTFLPSVSPLGCDFLSALLTPFPEERLAVRDALHHPWLRECVASE